MTARTRHTRVKNEKENHPEDKKQNEVSNPEPEEKEGEKEKSAVETKYKEPVKPTESSQDRLMLHSIIEKYIEIASPNVMVNDRTKIEAPRLLYSILTSLDNLSEKNPTEAKEVEDYIDKNTVDGNTPKVFNSIYITRECFSYDFLSDSERKNFFNLIKKYIKD